MKSLQQVVRFCSPDEAIATTARRVRDFYKIDDFFFLAAVLNCFHLPFVPK